MGIDRDEEAIASARRIWVGRKNLSFHRLDILDPLPHVLAPGIAGAGYDVAQLVFTLPHVSDAARCLANVREALRPGGVLWLFDTAERGIELPHPSLRLLLAARESMIDRAGTPRAAERHQGLLEGAGLEVLESTEVDEPMGGRSDHGRMALAATLLGLRSARAALVGPMSVLSATQFDDHMHRLASEVTPAMQGVWRSRLTIARKRA